MKSLVNLWGIYPFIRNNSLHGFAKIPRIVSTIPRQLRFSSLRHPTRQMDLIHDTVVVENLNTFAVVGQDQWKRKEPQPVQIDVYMRNNVQLAGEKDELKSTIHYGIASKLLRKEIEGSLFTTPKDLVNKIASLCFEDVIDTSHVSIKLTLPKCVLRSKNGLHYYAERERNSTSNFVDRIEFSDLELATILGIHAFERQEKQRVCLNISFANTEVEALEIARAIAEYVEQSAFLTIEALVVNLSKYLCFTKNLDDISIKAEKPSAITFANASAVQIYRTRSYFLQESLHKYESTKNKIAYLSFGSNIGDKFEQIQTALSMLHKIEGIRVLDVSPLYETEPMYYKDQPSFLNGVCKIETRMSPINLLRACQSIEQEMGRIKTILKGPRCIDLDIVLYEDCVYESEVLTIPHLGLQEREFVLRPLLALSPDLVHPYTHQPLQEALDKLPSQGIRLYSSFDNKKIINGALTMGILNVTPDSFSDGGKVSQNNILEKARSMVEDGASILDIGGQSTKPGADPVSVEEELRRVIPMISLLRSSGITVPISIDTYYSKVAKLAIEAGANIINDVTGGMGDEKMLPLAASLQVPICIMHMRGTPETMKALSIYEKDIVEEVAVELSSRVEAAVQSGVHRYNIILDPGFGFAKTPKQSAGLLGRLHELMKKPQFKDMHWLSGPSRKGFTGYFTGDASPKDRIWGTSACVTASVLQGVSIVRVHDTKEMSKVVGMANAIRYVP
ncbi:Folic acid synthesis protein fol1 [Schizosaccharomyces pombe]